MSVVKVGKEFENKGKTGKTHGKFKTKAGAEKQKAAMFANGYKCPNCGHEMKHGD